MFMLPKRLIALTLFASALAVMPASGLRAQWHLKGSPGPTCLVKSGRNCIAGTYTGIYLSTDTCKTWTSAKLGETRTHIITLFTNGPSVFAGTPNGVFLSTDDGNS